ncbi:MAG: hypothetical protein OXJ90_28445 [Spirochaetaceae bacterium]|nr:hypothetical protein [Spirochaetaceae bacterium]
MILPAEMIPDAHLAALALEHGLVVCSSDLGSIEHATSHPPGA